MLGLVAAVVWALVGLVGMLDLSADGETATPQATTAGATPSPSAVREPGGEDTLTRAERRAAAGGRPAPRRREGRRRSRRAQRLLRRR